MTDSDKAWQCERIRGVLARYCERLDEYDIDGVAACFAADAVTDYGAGRGGEVRGRDAIAARIRSGQAPFRRTHHQLGQIRVEFDPAGAAAISYMMTWHELADGRKDLVCLRYIDRLVDEGGEWLIARRRVEVTLVDGFDGVEWNWVERQPAD
ncbi:MAG: nuclear transport factor 2 family protein [Pseudomonadota bacterium]